MPYHLTAKQLNTNKSLLYTRLKARPDYLRFLNMTFHVIREKVPRVTKNEYIFPKKSLTFKSKILNARKYHFQQLIHILNMYQIKNIITNILVWGGKQRWSLGYQKLDALRIANLDVNRNQDND